MNPLEGSKRGSTYVSRLLEPQVEEALGDTPVVLLHGARQSGKTTLARHIGDRLGFGYLTFDDGSILAAAKEDPTGFVDQLPVGTILDEVQRVPELFPAIKRCVDEDRCPERLLLTGSANVLLLPKLSESLAGRMEVLRLHPLSQAELAGVEPDFLGALFAGDFPFVPRPRLELDLAERIVAGGFMPALARKTPERRSAWYRALVESLIQRDVQELTRIRSFDVLPRLLATAATQTAQLFNLAQLAGPFELTRSTIGNYVTLLEQLFLLEELPPWHSNRLSRLIKRPKLHMADTGIAAALLGLGASALYDDKIRLGHLPESFILQELRSQAGSSAHGIALHHFRTRDGVEVDVVLERGHNEVAGVEIKSGATVRSQDFRGLRLLQKAAGTAFKCGVVLYDGRTTIPYGDKLFAVPIRRLWENP